MTSGKNYEISLIDARIVRVSGKNTKLYFNLNHVGPFTLSIGKVGEVESQLIKYRVTGDSEWRNRQSFQSKELGNRVNIEVELEPGAEKYALQLVANNV